MHHIIQRAGLFASVGALSALAAPAQAQFGGIGSIVSRTRSAAAAPDACAQGRGRSNAGGRILGGIAASIAGDAANRAGVSSFVPVSEFTDQLSSSIACKLDPQEQKQAADATIEVTRGTASDDKAQVGATTAWTSETREGVSGRSTVTGREEVAASGMDCIMVTDVIIVSGEETRADKRMCRAPGSARYSIAV
jgi:hypothetical protein